MKYEHNTNRMNRRGSEVHADDYHEDVADDVNDGTMTQDTATGEERQRDEVGEVRKMSSKDSIRLRFWRLVVTCVLLLTAFAVTYTTFTLLTQQEDKNFKTAVRFGLLALTVCSSCSPKSETFLI
jgi:hypothetical protein